MSFSMIAWLPLWIFGSVFECLLRSLTRLAIFLRKALIANCNNPLDMTRIEDSFVLFFTKQGFQLVFENFPA